MIENKKATQSEEYCFMAEEEKWLSQPVLLNEFYIDGRGIVKDAYTGELFFYLMSQPEFFYIGSCVEKSEVLPISELQPHEQDQIEDLKMYDEQLQKYGLHAVHQITEYNNLPYLIFSHTKVETDTYYEIALEDMKYLNQIIADELEHWRDDAPLTSPYIIVDCSDNQLDILPPGSTVCE